MHFIEWIPILIILFIITTIPINLVAMSIMKDRYKDGEKFRKRMTDIIARDVLEKIDGFTELRKDEAIKKYLEE